VPGRQQQLDRAVAEQVVIAVDEYQLAIAERVIARQEEVPLDRRPVLTGLPLPPLHDERDRVGEQREAARVVEVQVRQHHAGDRAQVHLLGDVPLELKFEQGPPVERLRIAGSAGVQAGVDEDPLVLGLDQKRRDRKAHVALWILALAPNRRRRGNPAYVEHLDLHGAPALMAALSA
jgi:hypothetical protein